MGARVAHGTIVLSLFLLIVICILVFASYGVKAVYRPGIDPGSIGNLRPRLYLTSQKIRSIKSNLSKYPFSKFWAYTKATADRWASFTPPARPSGDIRWIGNTLPYISMAYLLTGDKKYLDAAIGWMNAICSYASWDGDKDLGAAHLLFGMSIAYDWLHDRFTPRQLRTYRETIERHAGILYRCLYNRQAWWAAEYLQNHNYVNSASIGVAGLALYGESALARSYIAAAKEDFQKVLPLLSPDGATHEGVGYWGYGTQAILEYFEAMRPIFGMEDILKSAFFRNTARFRLYCSLPGYVDNVDFADSPRFDWYGPGYILRELAGLFGDGTAQWLAERIEGARGSGALMSWLDLIWYDPSVESVPPDKMPKSAYFKNLGILILRSSWADDACWVFFKAAPPQGYRALSKHRFTGSHIHPDEGQFLIWNDGKWLVIDDGYVFLKRTSNHNVCTFNGTGQLGEGRMWFDEAPLRTLDKIPITVYSAKSRSGCRFIEADLTHIYGPGASLRSYKRTFVAFPSGYVLVRDRVRFKKTSDLVDSIHLASGAVKKAGSASFTFSVGGAGLGMDVYSINNLQTHASTFSIPHGEQGGSANFTGSLLRLEHANSGGDTLVWVLRPFKAGETLSSPKAALLSGGDRFSFADSRMRFSIDFADRTVSVGLQ